METQAVVEMLKSGKKDLEWFENNHDVLKKKYKNKFIAFKEGVVIGAEKNLDLLLSSLEERGVDLSCVIIRFMSDVKSIL